MSSTRLLYRRLPFSIPPIRRQARTMASSTDQKHEFIVIVPDKPNVRAKRLEIRPLHLKNMAPMIESGAWKVGGAVLNEVPKGDDPHEFDFAGSAIICMAESKQAVIEQLRNDIYTKEGVWDVDNAQIYAFKCAFR